MNDFVAKIRQEMEIHFGNDLRRIAHAHAVAGYATELLAGIDADPAVTLAAAYLHDIGIPEAERKHGSCAGHLQELEGPPVAREILSRLAAPGPLIETVCTLVGAHHTAQGVDSPEFRILWDADALVNLAEVLPGQPREHVLSVLDRAMVTEHGYRRAVKIFVRG